jgi:hypothetical protein
MPELGKLLVVLGAVILLLGLALWSGFGGGWLGRLPGDIRIQRGNFGFYFPVVTCIILSIVLSLLFAPFVVRQRLVGKNIFCGIFHPGAPRVFVSSGSGVRFCRR